jgi:hypothetical protein
LLNIKTKSNNSSSSLSSFLSFSKPLISFSLRDFSNINKDSEDEYNLNSHQQLNLIHLMNEKIFPLFNANISSNVPVNHPFINVIRTTFYKQKYSIDSCLFNYNGILYCNVYDNKDLLTSFKK